MIDLRDQRLRIYRPQNQGADGDVRTIYVFVAERWGRLDEESALIAQLQQRLQMNVTGVVTFAVEVADIFPAIGGVIVDAARPATAWWIRGGYRARATDVFVLAVDRMALEQFRTMQGFDSPITIDGAHLINPLLRA